MSWLSGESYQTIGSNFCVGISTIFLIIPDVLIADTDLPGEGVHDCFTKKPED